jgi:hypothetical protein
MEETAGEPRALPGSVPYPRLSRKLYLLGLLWATRGLAKCLGTADGKAVLVMGGRELGLILRSWVWYRFILAWIGFCGCVMAVPVLYRSEIGNWMRPSGIQWFLICGYVLQAGVGLFMVQWTVRRLRRDLYTSRLDELLLTRCSAADIAMGEALATAIASLWLVGATLPVALFLAGMAGQGWGTALRLVISLAPAAGLGVWFGMGLGLAFTLRRPSAAFGPMTDWWIKTPFIPVYVIWGLLLFVPIVWAVLALIHGGIWFLLQCLFILQWLVHHVVQHWNPLLTVAGAAGQWDTTWFSDWLVLFAVTGFMMRKSMDSVQASMEALPDRDLIHGDEEHWIHHNVHYFTQFGNEKRRVADYRDGRNPIAAFDVALGHRIYLHPFLWVLALMAYVSLLGWALFFPAYGVLAGTAAVLLPATMALLMMSGGVAVSFGWERDQHRWPSLAVLPIESHRLALGKIKGVVRPTLWMALCASLTALLLGVRGVLHADVALWMSVHVLVFPVALAFVSACLALTTPTLAESLLRWAVLGAIPTLATILPPPVGGETGFALPLTPPLLVLILVARGPIPALIRACWIALGLEVFGIAVALVVLAVFLRPLTVGEKD